jgi:predicted nucleotidyltransferase
MTIQQVHAVLSSHPDIRLAYVFGSIARNRARQDSDLDVAVQAEKPLDSAMCIQLIEDLTLATGRPVDLVDLQTVGEPLLGQILKHGQRIIGDQAAHVAMMSCHVYAMEDFMPYVNRMLAERSRATTASLSCKRERDSSS